MQRGKVNAWGGSRGGAGIEGNSRGRGGNTAAAGNPPGRGGRGGNLAARGGYASAPVGRGGNVRGRGGHERGGISPSHYSNKETDDDIESVGRGPAPVAHHEGPITVLANVFK